MLTLGPRLKKGKRKRTLLLEGKTNPTIVGGSSNASYYFSYLAQLLWEILPTPLILVI
jgi:hypothetical protein